MPPSSLANARPEPGGDGAARTAGIEPAPEAVRVLLAEDNAVNQKVAVRMLERLGYRADVVADGEEAVEALRHTPYDLVLMDMQMPSLDGLEATRLIRATVPAEQQPRIIAMTANAMKGDRERCLEAGMDDYVSKPVRFEELRDALRRTTTAVEPVRPRAPSAAFVPSVLNAFVDDDPAFVRELLTVFLTNTDRQVDALEAALAAGDAEVLGAGAHRLRSSCHACGAVGVAERAEALETWCRTEASEGPELDSAAAALVQALAAAYAEARTEIKAYLNEVPTEVTT